MPDAGEPLVGLDTIRAAAARLRGVAARTPLVALGDPARGHLLKAESLQPIGAFKIRGAYNAAAQLAPAERARGLITYSSGNHAQGVARAARLLGVPAVIVMPENAPAIKRARVLADGAEVVTVGNASAERQAVAERLAAERGLAMIPPYDDDRIIAGQGTCGLEIAEDLPDLAAVLVPIGGGGLASGVARGREGAPPGGAGRRRGAGAGGRRPGVAGQGRDRRMVRGRRLADDRRRHADAGPRGPDVRPPAGAPRRHRHRVAKRRSRRPSGSRPRRRASSSSRPAPCRSPPSASGRRQRAWRAWTARSSASSPAATSTRCATSPTSRRPSPRPDRRPSTGPEQAGRRRAPGGPRAHPRLPRAVALTPPRPASRRRSR